MDDKEYFNRSWSERIRLLAKHVNAGTSVLDLGCGLMELKQYLKQCAYYPVDNIKRSDEVILADFNNYEFPEIYANISFCSGIFEYVKDYNWFVEMIAKYTTKCIISYNSIDLYDNLQARAKNRWVNHLSEKEFIRVFTNNGFYKAYQHKYPYYIFIK